MSTVANYNYTTKVIENDQLRAENKRLRECLERDRAENTRLREELARAILRAASAVLHSRGGV